MNRERGQALILVLILLVVGSLMIVPFLQLTYTVLKGRMMYAQFIKEDYAADAAIEYSLWRLNWEPGFTDDWTVGDNVTFEFTLNGVTANITITMHTTEWLSGEGLEGDHQVKLTKEVTPATALPDVPTTFTYIITVQRLEPDDAIFVPLQSIKDGMDEGFVYVPDSSELDGVPFDDDDLTILQEPVIIEPMNTIAWSTTADEDSMVSQVSPTQNYGAELTMDVSSGVPSGNQTARSFMYFDISSLPAGGVIHSATLTLWAGSYPDVTRTYDVHSVTDNWTGTIINWNNQPAVAATATDSAETASDNSTPMEWDVLADLQDWLDGIETNYGWRVSDAAEEIGTEVYTVTVNDTLEFDTLKGLAPDIIPISGDVYAIAYAGDGDDGFLKTVQIATSGSITDTIIDTLEFDADAGKTPVITNVSGDIYAIAYAGKDDDGFVTTVQIATSGNITDTVIDTLEFDTDAGKTPVITNVSGDIYAIAYAGKDDDGFVTTVRIKSDGDILSQVDTLEFDTLKGLEPSIIPISGDVYAIAYAGDGDDGFLKTVQIAANGQITDTVIDTLEFDTVRGKTPDIIHIAGDIYAIAYTGSPADSDLGYLKTVEIASSGNIINTVIDTLEFDAVKGKTPDIIPISGDVYAIAYAGDGDDGFLKTVQIATSGNITDTVIDTLEFDTLKGATPDIIPISGDIYAIAYAGDGDDGFLTTVRIKSDGDILSQVDTLEFDTLAGKTPRITPVSGDVYAIAYAGDGDDGFLKTVDIAANGQIADTVIDSLEFDTVRGKTPDIIHIAGDIYAIAYTGSPADLDLGYLKTVEIASSGNIINTVIDTLEFDALKGKTPDIINVSGNKYVVAYAGDGDDGFLKTVAIADDGNISDTATNTLEFDTLKGFEPSIIPISGDVYAIAYAGDGDDGFLKTVDMVREYINHTTEFYTRENCVAEAEPKLTVGYIPLGGTTLQTIEWIFEPDLDLDYGQERTLSFKSRASLPDDTRYWNAAVVQPSNSYTGMSANVTVGNPPDTGIPGAGITVTKTADPPMIYPGEPTIVTYVISITNNDIGDFAKLDYIEDYLPPGFTYVAGSATLEWPNHNSTDNPAYQIYSQYYNIGDFEPDISLEADGRYKLKWHKKPSANGLFPGDDELLHDRDMPAGVTYTQTFQALADENVSGSYQNEVFVKLKDWNLYGDRNLGKQEIAYGGQTGIVMVPAFDILSETDLSTLRASAGWIADGSIVVRSWHWEERW